MNKLQIGVQLYAFGQFIILSHCGSVELSSEKKKHTHTHKQTNKYTPYIEYFSRHGRALGGGCAHAG